MNWKSNAKFGKDLMDGTIFTHKINKIDRVKIHRIAGLSGWFLTCYDLNISGKALSGDTFEEAVKESREIIGKRMKHLVEKYEPFVHDDTNLVLTY